MNEVDVKRIADALERMSPTPAAAPDFDAADAFVWHVDPDRLCGSCCSFVFICGYDAKCKFQRT